MSKSISRFTCTDQVSEGDKVLCEQGFTGVLDLGTVYTVSGVSPEYGTIEVNGGYWNVERFSPVTEVTIVPKLTLVPEVPEETTSVSLEDLITWCTVETLDSEVTKDDVSGDYVEGYVSAMQDVLGKLKLLKSAGE